jgi:hypothetical protein
MEKNVWTCMSCSRRFTRLFGRMLELNARPPEPELQREARADRRAGGKYERNRRRKT